MTTVSNLTIKINLDSKAFQLAVLEERYKMKVRIINDLNNEKLKQTKELNTILNKIYSLKESTK